MVVVAGRGELTPSTARSTRSPRWPSVVCPSGQVRGGRGRRAACLPVGPPPPVGGPPSGRHGQPAADQRSEGYAWGACREGRRITGHHRPRCAIPARWTGTSCGAIAPAQQEHRSDQVAGVELMAGVLGQQHDPDLVHVRRQHPRVAISPPRVSTAMPAMHSPPPEAAGCPTRTASE